MSIEYRILHSIEEIEQAVDTEIIVWGLDPRFAVPSNMMRAVSHNDSGGLVIGAYEDDKMVGMCFGFPARRENQWILWSHMTGVHPEYQSHGIGFGLKQAQRQWALAYGYRVIAWTFDPLQRGNANFNLHQLGTISSAYYENLYGAMTDDINRGMQSDRMETTWLLKDERVVRLAERGVSIETTEEYPDEAFLLRGDEGQPIINESIDFTGTRYFAEIPYDIKGLKQSNLESAKNWQQSLRTVMQSAFSHGLVAADFIVQDGRCWYVLRRFSAL